MLYFDYLPYASVTELTDLIHRRGARAPACEVIAMFFPFLPATTFATVAFRKTPHLLDFETIVRGSR